MSMEYVDLQVAPGVSKVREFASKTEGDGLSQVFAPDRGTMVASKLRGRCLFESDVAKICLWIRTRQALQLVSSDSADSLTPEILANWLSRAHACFVVSEEPTGEPVGFCTLSTIEVPHLPDSYIELCHLIVNPQRRYLFVGSYLCGFAKFVARDRGYQFLCGRVLLTNRYGLALARSQRADDFTDTESWLPAGFRWFRQDLSSKDLLFGYESFQT